MKLALTGIIVMVLVLATISTQHEVFAANSQQKTINILVLLNGKHVSGSACTVLTNGSPIAIKTTTNKSGQASVTVPSSATNADITCTSNSYTGQGTFPLTQQTTSVIIYLE